MSDYKAKYGNPFGPNSYDNVKRRTEMIMSVEEKINLQRRIIPDHILMVVEKQNRAIEFMKKWNEEHGI